MTWKSDPHDDPVLDAVDRHRRANTPRGRLLKIAEIPQLRAEAESLLLLFPAYKHYSTRPGLEFETGLVYEQITSLERRAVRWQLSEQTGRDARRQAGTRKRRGSRWAELDAWIESQIAGNPKASAKELWREIELEYSSSWGDIYFDDERIWKEGQARPLGFDGFQKRTTQIRKRLNSEKNRRK